MRVSSPTPSPWQPADAGWPTPDSTVAARPRLEETIVSRLLPVLVTWIALAIVPTPSHAATVPPPPASGWLFDDGDGTAAVDSWGPYHGTLEGGMGTANWLTTTPKDYSGNRCLSFDGVNDRIRLSDGHILSAFTSSTISAWFQWTDTAPRKEYAIYSERDECQYNVFILEVEDRLGVPAGVAHGVFNRNPFPAVCGSGTWNVARDGSGLPSTGDWHHVVAIRKDDGEVRIFVDRELVGIQTGVASYHGGNGFTTIGHTHTVGYDSYFAGKLDEIAVWTTALTDSEAVWLYDHSLRDVNLVGVDDVARALPEGPRLSAGPLPYRGGGLRIVWDCPSCQDGGEVDFVLTDLQGRVLREVAAVVPANRRYAFTWDGRDRDGCAVPPGVYFLRASGSEGRHALKFAVLR